MESTLDITRLDALVGRIFRIEDFTVGNPEKDFIVRYRGRLLGEDSQSAYDYLAEQLRPLKVTPLFRIEEGRHVILLVPGRPQPGRSNPWVNLGMFLATLLSVMLVGGLYNMTAATTDWLRELPGILWQGWPFAVSLLAILGAHEFGHYLMGRKHGVHVTLPYFIPLPISPFGTMGAVINMKEPAKNRRHLLDIGLAGPLAGLAVAIPVLLIGLSLSNVEPLPTRLPPGMGLQLEGNSVLYLFLKFVVFGQLLPAPASFGNVPEWLYWLRFFFTGQPYPMGGVDVVLHPVAWAGWAGILVTALNLIPVGQFDGGHILYVLVGRKRALQLLPFILGAVALLGIFWMGWWLWLALILVIGRFHAEPLDQITPLDTGRRWLAVFAIIVFLLVFTPVPISLIGAS
jgi:membrane-associated protease RseP (regulator of RpoE activity)